jgi:hypothetical protein
MMQHCFLIKLHKKEQEHCIIMHHVLWVSKSWNVSKPSLVNKKSSNLGNGILCCISKFTINYLS